MTKHPYTVVTNPLPQPLLEAMSSLHRAGGRTEPGTDGAWRDEEGHHLIVTKGALTAHLTLALDHYEDGVDWADGDLTWNVTRDETSLTLARWSDVYRTFQTTA